MDKENSKRTRDGETKVPYNGDLFRTGCRCIDLFLKELKEKIKNHEKEKRILELAEFCLRSYRNNALLEVSLESACIHLRRAAETMRTRETDQDRFNAILERFGLKLEKMVNLDIVYLQHL